jgi:hypothetical protein
MADFKKQCEPQKAERGERKYFYFLSVAGLHLRCYYFEMSGKRKFGGFIR